MIDSQAPPVPIQAVKFDPDATGADRPAAGDDHSHFVSQLVERHRDALLRHLTGLLSRRADAEDILQEACVRMLKVRHLDRTASRARAYMFRIATNLAYDRFRTQATESFESGGHEALLSCITDQPDLIAGFEQGFDIVRKTLLELKPRRRRVFLLRASEELSYEAIAERLGVSKRTVEREMKHALDTFQRRLKRQL